MQELIAVAGDALPASEGEIGDAGSQERVDDCG